MNIFKKVSLITCAALAALTGVCTAEFATKKKKTPSESTLKQECGNRFGNVLSLMPQIDNMVSRLLALKADLQLSTLDHLTTLLEGSNDAKKFFGRATKTELHACEQQLCKLEHQLTEQMEAIAQLENAVRAYKEYLCTLDTPVVKSAKVA
jgi:hypothetical protein